jgi:CrcB protein
MTVLLVVAGAAIGAPLRYLVDRFVQLRRDSAFPWGTLTVNVAGSFILGLLTITTDPTITLLFGVGFCGAFTTYSTFGYETIRLAEDGARLYALLNVLVSLGAGLAAAILGVLLARSLT